MGLLEEVFFFEAPGFDVVRDMVPEPMHLLDRGFMKNTCGRTFKCGTGHQTEPGYRRTPSGKLSDKMRLGNM